MGSDLASGVKSAIRVARVVQDVALALFVISYSLLAIISDIWPREQEEIVVSVSIVVDVQPVLGLAIQLGEERVVAVLVAS